MKKNKLIALVLAAVLSTPMLPPTTKVNAGDNIPQPQININGKAYNAVLSNHRVEGGNDVYDVSVAIPDCNTDGKLEYTSYNNETNKIDTDTQKQGFQSNQAVSLSYDGKNYSGYINKRVDIANDDSTKIDKEQSSDYKKGKLNGTAYRYDSSGNKKIIVKDYLYNNEMVDSNGSLKSEFQGQNVIALFNAIDSNSKLNIGASIAETNPLANGNYILSGKNIGGSLDLTKTFLVSSDGYYTVSSKDMQNTGGQNSTVTPYDPDTFTMLHQSMFGQVFPQIEGWDWRTDDRTVTSHTPKIGDNWFHTDLDATLNDVKVKTTNEPISANYFDVATDIYLADSEDAAQKALADLPETITRNMYAFSRNSVTYRILTKDGQKHDYNPCSGSPMDKSDFDIEKSKLQSKDPVLASLLGTRILGAVNFKKSDIHSKVLLLDKSETAVTGSSDDVRQSGKGYYLRMVGQYHYGACNITHKIQGSILEHKYVGAIHYEGTLVSQQGKDQDPTSTTKGKIVFDPESQIPWSNKGKSDGYKVTVSCTAPNVQETWVQKYNIHAVTSTQVPTGKDKDGNITYTTQTSTADSEQDVKFNVYYKIGDISVSGNCTPSTVTSGGQVLVQEGFQSKLHGTAAYQIDHKDTPVAPNPSNTSTTTYTVSKGDVVKPSGCIESDPNITGDSGIYDIDYTNPDVSFSVSPGTFQGSGVTRKASTAGQGDGLYGTLSYSDNLSGVSKVQYSWTFGSGDTGAAYTTVYASPVTTTNRSAERLSSDIEKPVGDNLYLHVKVTDMAGNETDSTYGPYEDPIKLKNFRVVDVRDPAWDKVFWTDDSFTKKTGNYYDAPRLPIDWNSNPLHPSASSDHPTGAPKKGYAFYFDIDSEYLYRLNDQVTITPTFYWTDGSNQRIPVDLYYTTGVNTLVKAGSKADKQQFNITMNDIKLNGDKKKILIGNLQQEILFDSVRLHQYDTPYSAWEGNIQYQYGKEQTWYGKYFIPATSKVYIKGSKVDPKNELKKGYIIINFQIVGKKNGAETNSSDQTFTYVPDQWKAEGGPKQFASYQAGDIIVHDNEYSVLDDYDSKGTQ